MPMKVSELGEFGLIDLIADIVGGASSDKLVLGIGDDTAAWRPEGALQLGTTDVLIQDVHFTLKTAKWRDLGWKALAINISDIAAMGGQPLYALVSVGLPPDTEVDDIREFCQGMLEVAGEFGVEICGGNVSVAPAVMINVSLIGEATDNILTRSAASAGDYIAVTGYLGQSAAGLEMLVSGLEFDVETNAYLRAAHLRPYPRINEGKVLAQNGVKAAIDLSDGLLGDLTHVCKASNVGAKLRMDSLPVHPFVRAAFGDKSLEFAISGGEDYELLFTAKTEAMEQLRGLMPGPITVIGEIVSGEPGQVTLLDENSRIFAPVERGWDHFRSM